MKIKVTMIMDIEADTLDEAEELYWDWDDSEFIAAVADAEVTVESAE